MLRKRTRTAEQQQAVISDATDVVPKKKKA
jgi:hypothetical protein